MTPPIAVPCPPINFVADSTTISAPCSIGLIRYGVPNVLSMIRGIPALCAIAEIASISATSHSGCLTFQYIPPWFPGFMAASTSLRSSGFTKVAVTP